VPTIEIGRAILGITVAERLRKKRKITITTSTVARNKLNFTSLTEARTFCEASSTINRWMEGGSTAVNCGRSCFTPSTTSIVFAPGCRCTASTIAGLPAKML